MSKYPLIVSGETHVQILKALQTKDEVTVYLPALECERTFTWKDNVIVDKEDGRVLFPSRDSFAQSVVTKILGPGVLVTETATEEQANEVMSKLSNPQEMVALVFDVAFGDVSTGEANCSAAQRQTQVNKLVARLSSAPPSSSVAPPPPPPPPPPHAYQGLVGTVLPDKQDTPRSTDS